MLLLLVFCATLIPRLMMIGAPPATDEGIYAFNTLMIYLNPQPSNLLPELGTLSVYQALVAWVFSLEINQFVLLRALDALVASLAGLMLYHVTSYESKSKIAGAVIAIVFLITLNDPVFIQYGFKNSIFAANIPLLAAIGIGQRITPKEHFGWFSVGGLMAIAVLLREPFATFALVGLLAVMIKGGRVALRHYVFGGVVVGGLVLMTMLLMRGGYHQLFESYSDLALAYNEIGYQRLNLFKASSISFLKNAISVLLLFAVAIFCILRADLKHQANYRRLSFWLMLALVPLLEPLFKNGYPYHYASTLFGLAGVVALGWCVLSESNNKNCRLTMLVLFPIVFFLIPKLIKFNDIYTEYTAQLGKAHTSIDWPLKTVKQSNYLLIAQHIHGHSDGSPTVAINGSMLGVIPLAKAIPSNPELAHLSYRFIHIGKNKERLKAEIEECPPEFIMLTNSSPFNDTKLLHTIVRSIPEYQLSTYIPGSNVQHYGSFDGAIFKWMGKSKHCQHQYKRQI
jgi:hypothetical protein